MAGAPNGDKTRESQAKFRDGTMWGLQKGPAGSGHAWSVFGDIRFKFIGKLWLNVVLTPV